MASAAFSDMKAPAIELWENMEGKWAWVMVDRPDVNEPGTVLFDTGRHDTAELALADVDALLRRWEWGYAGTQRNPR